MVSEIIKNLGIKINDYSDGEHKSICPWCSHTRKKKTLKCLSVKIEGSGFRFFCHHCGKKGTENETARGKSAGRRDGGSVWRERFTKRWY